MQTHSFFSPVLASGVAPPLHLISVLGGLAMVVLAGWFLVISQDVATNFRRFASLDEATTPATPKAAVHAQRA